MPFVVLKKKKLSPGQEDLMVVPDVWVEETLEDENAFVFLPVADCNTIKTYLEEQRAPFAGWEKHECEVLCRNIPNLISAYNTIEKIQNEKSLDDFVELFDPPIPKKRLKRDEPKKKVAVEKTIVEEDEQKVFPLFRADQENEDPFGDIIPPLEMPLSPNPEELPFEENVATVNTPKSMDKHTLFTSKVGNDPLGTNWTVTSQSRISTEINSDRSKSSNKRAFTVEDDQQSDYDAPIDDDPSSDYNAPSDGYTPSNGDTQSWSSRKKRQPTVSDKPREAKQIAQLYDLMNELKCMMISNQEEIKKNMRESFVQMQATMVSLIKQSMIQYTQPSVSKEPEGTHHQISSDGTNVFKFKKLLKLEDVIRFDNQLTDVGYRKQFYHMINVALKDETNSSTRLRIALFIIFDRKLFNQFSWDGEDRKMALRSYKQITKVLEYSGTTPTHRMSSEKVGQFIQSMNTIQHVKRSQTNQSTAQSSTARSSTAQSSVAPAAITQTAKPKASVTQTSKPKAAVKTTHKIANPTLVKEAVSMLEQHGILCIQTVPVRAVAATESRTGTGKTILVENSGIICKPVTMPIPSEAGKTIQVESATGDAQTMSEANRLRNASANNVMNKSTIITNVIALHNFEKRLYDTNMREQILQWIDKFLGNELDVEKRLLNLFNRLIDITVLRNFDWTKSKGKCPPLSGYTQFIELFVYASNVKKESEPTPSMRQIVTNFFIKQLTDAGSSTQQTNLPGSSTSVSTT
uniref:DUF4806 domain-containing protein n=1 Tax=Anopheles funestus TaxID=62324 RepID=A0A4Y0BDL1_ANOFN